MKIKLTSLNLTNFDPENKRNIKLLNDLKKDQLTNLYVSSKIEEFFYESKDANNISVGNTYICNQDKTPIGFIKLYDFLLNELEIFYGVSPEYRNQGYGKKILIETSYYLFKRYNNVKNIKLLIRDNNIRSIKCALNAGFKLNNELNELDDVKILVYKKYK